MEEERKKKIQKIKTTHDSLHTYKGPEEIGHTFNYNRECHIEKLKNQEIHK